MLRGDVNKSKKKNLDNRRVISSRSEAVVGECNFLWSKHIFAGFKVKIKKNCIKIDRQKYPVLSGYQVMQDEEYMALYVCMCCFMETW